MRFRLVCPGCYELAELLPPREWDGPGERPTSCHAADRTPLCEIPPEPDPEDGRGWYIPAPIMVQVRR